ncbi:unnamed protein product [Thelazia callipaeda]|uniref:Secreted protein n=1 Tax=Thelazia callipaeda TaxID=103827 RepID=A0A0N5CTY4_THECL|nr:unnamed protein product [Thelazia callipaeda]
MCTRTRGGVHVGWIYVGMCALACEYWCMRTDARVVCVTHYWFVHTYACVVHVRLAACGEHVGN